MFEGVVRQLLLGYLGRYIKDFHKEQLKITLWNEEVLFENVELILEAFDYLQLPFALKQGRVGRLSIRIPWKKLGWDPIIILIEDVFFSVGERDNHEWNAETVEKRELAAKKAKLAAAELAKLSKRVCDNQSGQSFVSHITGRILDNIHISMKNVHISYCEMLSDKVPVFFGVRFTSLKVMKHSHAGSSTWSTRSSQVSKIVEIQGLGIYCATYKGSLDLVTSDDVKQSKPWPDTTTEAYDYILIPFDASLLVIKSGKVEHDAPQYSVTAVLTKLVMSIDANQLRHILVLSDNICTCQLREMYGRYRPLDGMLSRKTKGWEKAWWHYAQNAILSDVHNKLKKSSWRYLGERLGKRRKYVNLYKRKLSLLQNEQTVDEDVIHNLEQMEKDIDLEDILDFRAHAERQLEESPSSSPDLVNESNDFSAEKSQNDDNPSRISRGWLNWLSRGVLGVGGTDDSNQFSGVVSDEIIKDICEATKFEPMPFFDGEVSPNGVAFISAISLNVNHISLTLRSIKFGYEIAEMSLDIVMVECKIWDGSATVSTKIFSAGLLDSFKKMTLFQIGRIRSDKNALEDSDPSISLLVDISSTTPEAKIMLQPLKIDFHFESFLKLTEFHDVLMSVKLQEDRVLESLNGIRDTKSRLASKAEHYLSRRRKLLWDVNLVDISMSFPWSSVDLSQCSLVMKFAALRISSDCDACSSITLGRTDVFHDLVATETSDMFSGFQIQELYASCEVKFSDFEVLLMMPDALPSVSVLEKVCFSTTLSFCIIPEEISLKKLQAHISIPLVHAHISPLIYGAFVRVADHQSTEKVRSPSVDSLDIIPNVALSPFYFSADASIGHVKFEIHLENDSESSSILMISLQQLQLRYDHAEVYDALSCVEAIDIITCIEGAYDDSLILWSSTAGSHVQLCQFRSFIDLPEHVDGCLILQYRGHKERCSPRHSCAVRLSNTKLHCYPKVVQLLFEFCDKLAVYHGSNDVEDSVSTRGVRCSSEYHNPAFKRFGFSNFHDTDMSECASIPVEQFPFVMIQNSGSLADLEGSLLCPIPDWRKNKISSEEHMSSGRKDNEYKRTVGDHSEDEKPSLSSHIKTIMFTADLNLTCTEIHFHDDSCVIGSITLPVGNAFVGCHPDCLDVLCSTEGLTLSSALCSVNPQDLLWAPLHANRPPIMNMRVRSGFNVSPHSDLEISLGIQHVCCCLPPDLLAILIGYFSLSDWITNESKNEAKHELGLDDQYEMITLFKFEVLDSAFISSGGRDDKDFLKVSIEEFYGSYIGNDASGYRLDDVLPECLVQPLVVAEGSNSLNMFGRSLSLSFLPFKGETRSVAIDQYTDSVLIQSLDADLWIRLPCEHQSSRSPSTEETISRRFIIAKVSKCEIVAQDLGFSYGVQHLIDVLGQYSLVEKASQCYSGDVEKFFQLKWFPENNILVPVGTSNVLLTEVRVSADLLSMKLHHASSNSVSEDMLAGVDSKFLLLASLKDESILELNVQFFAFSLSSLVTSVVLAKCSSDDSSSAALDLHLSVVEKDEVALVLTLPSFDVWLYLSEWLAFLDLVESYISLLLGKKPSDSTQLPTDLAQDPTVSKNSFPCQLPQTEGGNLNTANLSFTLSSNNIGISCHIPVSVGVEPSAESEACCNRKAIASDINDAPAGGKERKFVTVFMRSKTFEVFVDSIDIKVMCTFGKLIGSVGVYEADNFHLWPFFQLFQLCMELKVDDYKIVPLHAKVEVRAENLDIWLSHQVLCFWNQIEYGDSQEDHMAYMSGRLDLNMQLRKVSLLLTDGRGSCSGPLMELLLKNLYLEISIVENSLQLLVFSELYVNYSNIHKVLWEPFVEPWTFQFTLTRKQERSALLDSGIVTDIRVTSSCDLNINISEALIEPIFRVAEMIRDAEDLMQADSVETNRRYQNYKSTGDFCARRYAPYIVSNMTSLPFKFHIHHGPMVGENIDISVFKEENTVPSGRSVPIYFDEEVDEDVFYHKPSHSSDGLSKKHSIGVGHHFMSIQFEGSTKASELISIDLAGLTYFEVDFSKGNNKAEWKNKLLVPVVFDVSVQRHSKLIQLYSTVILTNATSTPLELRFDIPFGLSPKIVDPLYPGQEFPLPLHLAEAGRISWRPLGNSYLWSEYHNIASILSQEGRRGFLRSLVCYPSHPSNDQFRCCLSVQDILLPFAGRPKTSSCQPIKGGLKQWARTGGQVCSSSQSNLRFIHHVILNTPLLMKNYLTEAVSVVIESGGTSRSVRLEEAETSLFHIDSSHDLRLTFLLHGFETRPIKFPRAETFGSVAKSNGSALSLTETVVFHSQTTNGPIYVTMEMRMYENSGARELYISVPFLLYNCTGFSLCVLYSEREGKGNCVIVPSCYSSTEQELFISQKEGLGLSSCSSSLFKSPHLVGQSGKSSIYGSMVTSGIATPQSDISLLPSSVLHDSSSDRPLLQYEVNTHSSGNIIVDSRILSSSQMPNGGSEKVKPFIYSPDPNIPASEITVKLSMTFPDHASENTTIAPWSTPFFLVVPSGSTTVLVPQPFTTSAAVISVTSSLLDVALSGRTRAICFQPRYIICNACDKDLCFKQKGTDTSFHLGVRQHSHLHWPDTSRELLVSVRFDDPGWQWSGSFSPDHPGDQQVKMRNYLSSALNMIRVEVQNADDVCKEEKVIDNLFRSSGTNFILLSNDDTGFIPYRIDNFSKETVRIYQQKCETLQTIIQPYNSCPYAWDEPCYPHRLVVEVLGERIIGSFNLDEVNDYAPVRLQSSYEKRERVLLLSVYAEGAMKVLTVVDSSIHVLGDQRDSKSGLLAKNPGHSGREENLVGFKEKLSVSVSSVGISLVNSLPQEILFFCAKGIKIDFSQTVEQQKLSFQILSLQIDNQLRNSQYPVIFSFDQEHRGNIAGHARSKDGDLMISSEIMTMPSLSSSCEAVISLSVAKWRNKDTAVVSFECISLRIADFHLELDQELLLSLVDFFRAAALAFQSTDSTGANLKRNASDCTFHESEFSQFSQSPHYSKFDKCFHQQYVKRSPLPEVVPVGAPWQKIFLLARRHNKIYIEAFYVAPVNMTLSFSSNPWMLKNGTLPSRESLIHRGLVALADVEGASIRLKQLTITHHIASWESIREIVSKHYTKQILHEMYKVLGSAGVIGNPMGFARRVGHGFKDFFSVPARGVLESPAGLITGVAHGTTSLLSNTLYAVSDAATQFSKAAHKGILAFTYNDQDFAQLENPHLAASSYSKGVISELLEGLTGLLQSPIKGAEKHGLPGVFSGFALGVTGLVARPAASVLEATGRTAQSIRNRSKLHRMGHHPFRVRLPRALSRELALQPYSWEEAVGTAVLLEADDNGLNFRDESLVLCKELKGPGKFMVLTERLLLVVNCPSLVDLGTPKFQGIVVDPEWVIEDEIVLMSVIHADTDKSFVHIVGSRTQTLVRPNLLQLHQRQGGSSSSNNGSVGGGGRVGQRDRESSSSLPLFQTSLELGSEEEAKYVLLVLLSVMEQGKEQGWGSTVNLLHQNSLR